MRATNRAYIVIIALLGIALTAAVAVAVLTQQQLRQERTRAEARVQRVKQNLSDVTIGWQMQLYELESREPEKRAGVGVYRGRIVAVPDSRSLVFDWLDRAPEAPPVNKYAYRERLGQNIALGVFPQAEGSQIGPRFVDARTFVRSLESSSGARSDLVGSEWWVVVWGSSYGLLVEAPPTEMLQ